MAHRDAAGAMPGALNRSVSYSLMLSEQGEDFAGGDFRTRHGTAHQLRKADMIGFTSKTEHTVTAVESGHRLVLVCFGSWR